MRISANGAFAHVEYVFAAIKGYIPVLSEAK